MLKKLFILLMVAVLVSTSGIMVSAFEKPVVYKDTITVTAEGGRYQIGFVQMEFKKEFLNPALLPATFDVEVKAESGIAAVYINPDTQNFFKKVHIRTHGYKGLLYDEAAGENIEVNIKNQQILAEHFSWYRFR